MDTGKEEEALRNVENCRAHLHSRLSTCVTLSSPLRCLQTNEREEAVFLAKCAASTLASRTGIRLKQNLAPFVRSHFSQTEHVEMTKAPSESTRAVGVERLDAMVWRPGRYPLNTYRRWKRMLDPLPAQCELVQDAATCTRLGAGKKHTLLFTAYLFILLGCAFCTRRSFSRRVLILRGWNRFYNLHHIVAHSLQRNPPFAALPFVHTPS